MCAGVGGGERAEEGEREREKERESKQNERGKKLKKKTEKEKKPHQRLVDVEHVELLEDGRRLGFFVVFRRFRIE